MLAKCPRRVTATTVADSVASANRIHIEQLELEARIGVTEEERAGPQRLVLNLTVWPTAAFGGLRDDLAQTVNYAELCRSAREFVQGRTNKLIETLAHQLASHLLGKFPLEAVEVEVRKFVLPNTKYVSATVRLGTTG